MKAALVLIVLAVFAAIVVTPAVAAYQAVSRATSSDIGAAIMLVAGGVTLACLGFAFKQGATGLAAYRQAQFPAPAAPSHNIDARRQNIDARRQVVLVDANGQPVALPAGMTLQEADSE